MPPRTRATTAKSTAKKAAPRPRAQKVQAFDEFRKRAAGMNITASVPEPVVLGKEHGFDPPVVARWPETLAQQVMLTSAVDSGRPGPVLQIFLGTDQLLRVAQMFDQFPDGDALLVGLASHLWERFIGPGSGDVPGGSRAS